jgi:HSP20 family molecular chaperone IbpA
MGTRDGTNVDDFFGRRLAPFSARWWPARNIGFGTPAVDLYEEKDEIVAKAELPGMTKDDVEVNITGSVLTIRGEKKQEEEIKKRLLSVGACVRSVYSQARIAYRGCPG